MHGPSGGLSCPLHADQRLCGPRMDAGPALVFCSYRSCRSSNPCTAGLAPQGACVRLAPQDTGGLEATCLSGFHSVAKPTIPFSI